MTEFPLHKTVDALVGEGRTVDEIVEFVVTNLSNDEAAFFVRQHARHLVVVRMRSVTRDVEVEIAGPLFVNRAQELVGHMFCLPDGRWVGWLDATAEDHLARAGWQRGRARAIVADAERHESAAREILEAGVSCLRELPQARDMTQPRQDPPAAQVPAETREIAKPISAASRRSQSSEPSTDAPKPIHGAGARKTGHDSILVAQPTPRPSRGRKSDQPIHESKPNASPAGRESGAAA